MSIRILPSLFLLLVGITAFAGEPAPLRVLMVTGGCCHDFAAQKRILSEGISARAHVEWTIVHEGIPSPTNDARSHRVGIYEKPDWSKGYDVILHNECFAALNDAAFVERITAAHKAGLPAVMLHCAANSYRASATDEWRMAVGITSSSHEKIRDLTVQRLAGNHPVMAGFPDKWLDRADELYKNEKIWPNVIPLATVYGEETKRDHVCIWLNTFGKARIFSTTLGHSNATMSDPVYLDLITRGLLWTCDRLDDNGAPKSGYGPRPAPAK